MPPPAETFASRLFLGPALRTQPDRRLVTLVREGYESAFEEIVRRYGKPLTRYAAAIVGSRGEDVAQDAFSKALLALRRNDAEIELRPWLFRIVRNTALNDLRDSPPTPELLAEAIAGGDSPAEELERREELTELMHRLQSLPEPQRAAIVMREMEGLSHEEIAAALGVSGGAARQTIHRARQTLRNGAGMLIPLPLLKAVLAAGTMGTPEVATAGVGGTVGAGVALKAVTATVLVAGAVGAGVAVHDSRHASGRTQQAAASQSASQGATPSPAFAARVSASSDDRSGRERGDNHGRGPGSGQDGDDSHSGSSGSGGSGTGGGGHSGPGHGGSSDHDGGSGPSESSGSDYLASDFDGGSSEGGPGLSETTEPDETSSGSSGSGPSDGSDPSGTSGSGSGSGADFGSSY
ncbi:MAG TPA: RNA polymerase sigma factor [Solirubrobacterales bacterium]